MLKVAYGYEVSPDNDQFIDRIENFFTENEKVLGRPYLVDFIPLCGSFLTGLGYSRNPDKLTVRFLPEGLPFTNFKRVAREYKSLNVEGLTYNWAKKLIVRGHVLFPSTVSN